MSVGMTLYRILFVLVSLSACASQGAPTPSSPKAGAPRDPQQLQGIWHACAAVGAGFCERIVLAPEGRYEARAAQDGCERVVARGGQWSVEGDTLVLKNESEVELVGGQCEEKGESKSLVGATRQPRKLSEPKVERLPIGDCDAKARDASPAACIRFGETTHYRLATDESMGSSL